MKGIEYHPFRSRQAREKYLKAYDNTEKFWPVPHESKMVDTSYGQTLVRISGPEDAPPLVLLHGVCCSSLMWMPQIEALSKDFHTFAVDDIYDYGRSIYTKAVKSPVDYVNWLDGLFNALELENNINLMGLSYGGWQTSQYMLRFPERLNSIVLIAPAATVLPTGLPVGGLFFRPAMRAFLTRLIPETFFDMHMRWMVKNYIKRDQNAAISFVHCYSTASKCFKPKTPPLPTVLSDHQLKNINIPVLVLIGEKEIIYPAKKALERLNRVAPQVKTALIPAAGHDLVWTQTDLVNQKILEFLRESGA